MSGYRTHTLFNLLFALPLLVLGCRELLHLNWFLTLTGASTFAYGTLFMSPDMDLAHQIKLFSIRGFCTIPFRTYSKFFRHRGLSHSVLFGTVTRLLWLSLHALVILVVIYEVSPTSKSFLQFFVRHRLSLTVALSGLFIADCCHLLLDRFGPAH